MRTAAQLQSSAFDCVSWNRAGLRLRTVKVIALWLMPAVEEAAFLAALVRRLAIEQDAPLFEPHLTVYAGQIEPAAAVSALREIKVAGSYASRVERVACAEKFRKTVFVQLAPSAELQQLSDALCRSSKCRNGYELNPHVSLIYKEMPEPAKVTIARAVELPFESISFDRLKVITGPDRTECRADVESWCTLAERTLS